MKYFSAVVLLVMSLVVQTNYAQQQPQYDFPLAATKVLETQSFIRTELFFGRNKPDGTEVSETEFTTFLDEVITPQFPDGLTVVDGIGQFRDAKGLVIREKSKVLILLYPSNTRRQSSRKIERIRNAYKERFQQQSVLRVDDELPVKVSF
jgi:Protein of unknown function (DUF3574)